MRNNERTRQAASRDKPRRRLAAGALGLVLGLAMAGGPGSARAAADDNQVPKVDAMAEASLAYVQVNWSGFLVIPREIETSASTVIPAGVLGPFDPVTSCSGFVASRAGDVVTAGHCVDAASFEGGKGAILEAALATWRTASGAPLTAAEMQQRRTLLRANASVEGSDSGSPVDRTVQVTVPSVSTTPRTANVVAVQPFTQGDVALLRVANLTAPVLPLASAEPQNGDDIVAAGYAGSVAEVVDPGTGASYKEGKISGTQTVNGAPFTETSAAISAGMSGGPVLDMAGRVVGTVSWSPTGTTAAANFITDVGSIRALLSGNGVDNTLGAGDKAYRQGLTYYFAGRYHDAVKQLDKALTLQPDLKLASSFREKAVANYPNEVTPPSSTGGGPAWWVYALVAAAVVLVAGTGVLLFLRRRGMQATPGSAPPAPQPPPTSPSAPAPEPAGYGRVETAPEATAPAVLTSVPSTASAAAPPAGAPEVTAGAGPEEEHHFCTNCGAEHVAEAHYCEHCGQPFPTGHGVQHTT